MFIHTNFAFNELGGIFEKQYFSGLSNNWFNHCRNNSIEMMF